MADPTRSGLRRPTKWPVLGGGVGTTAVQVAKAYGASVTALCGPRSVETVRNCGADEIIDYTTSDPGADGARYDVVFAVNGASKPVDLPTAAQRRGPVRGHRRHGPATFRRTTARSTRLSFGARTATVVRVDDERRQSDLEELCALLGDGRLRPVIDRTFPRIRVTEAFAYVESGHVPGKVVLTLDAPADRPGGGTGHPPEAW